MASMVIGIHGELGSGKDTICRILCEHFNSDGSQRAYRKAHADTLKHIVSLLTGIDYDELFIEDVKNSMCEAYGMTYGQMLQQLGTNVLRNWDQNIWVKALYSNYTEDRILVIPDVRFPNEAEKVRSMGGKLIKIFGDPVGANANSTRDKNHPSETAMRQWTDWDYVVDNTGTYSELIDVATVIAAEIMAEANKASSTGTW